jgi:hypothetical protein
LPVRAAAIKRCSSGGSTLELFCPMASRALLGQR